MKRRDLIAIIIAVAYLLPLVWMFTQGFRPRVDIFAIPPKIIPTTLTLSHFENVFIEFKFATPFFRSLIVAGLTTAIVLVLSVLTGYGLSRYKFTGVNFLLIFIIFVRVIIPAALLVPLYDLLVSFHLINTPIAIVMGHLSFTLPLMLWLSKTFIDEIPEDLEEQAAVDGMSTLQRIRHVIVPMAAPGLAVIAILTFVFSWGEYMFAVSFGSGYMVGSTAIANMMTTYRIWWGEIAASGLIFSIPVLIIGIFFQKYLVRGLTAGAIKG